MLDEYLRSHFICSCHHFMPTELFSIEHVKKRKVDHIVSIAMKTEELGLSDLPHVKAQVGK